MFSAVRVKGTFLRLAAPDRRRQKRWERGGAIRENAGSAERRRDRKSPREQGGCSHGLGCILVGLLWSRLFLNALIGRFFRCIDRSAVSFSVAPLREASPFTADNIRISYPYLFPAFLNPGMATGRGRSAGAFPRIKGRPSGYAAPFQGRPTAASSGGAPSALIVDSLSAAENRRCGESGGRNSGCSRSGDGSGWLDVGVFSFDRRDFTRVAFPGKVLLRLPKILEDPPQPFAGGRADGKNVLAAT